MAYNIAYFKQNIKKEQKGFRSFFKVSSKLYNMALNELNKQVKAEEGYRGWESIKSSLNGSYEYKLLGDKISTSIIRNLDINYNNFRKDKTGIFKKPDFRNTDLFVAFFGSIRGSQVIFRLTNEFKNKYGVNDFKIDIADYFKFSSETVQVRFHIKKNKFFLVYNYKIDKKYNYGKNNMGIDLGMNNLLSCYVDNNSRPFIIRGFRIKYINYKYIKGGISIERRDNLVNAYFNDSVRYIFNIAIRNNVGSIYVGDFKNIKDGNVAHNFFMIRYKLLKRKLRDAGNKYGIRVIFGDESYTSKSSFLDYEYPKYRKDFVGNRETRGLFVSKGGYKINADINGAANILVKISKKTINNRENVIIYPRILNK